MKQITLTSPGHMGTPTATNLLKAGYLLNVFDLMQSTVDGLVAVGTSAARSARDAVQSVNAVISMLPASQHVGGLHLDDGDLLAHTAPGTPVLECSATVPTSARKVHAVIREHGLVIFDAPVSDGITGVATGTLTFTVGGDAEALEKARPLFEAMGRNIFHTGPDSAGQITRTCNNQLLAVLMIDTAETMALDVANGLGAKALAEVIRHGSGGNWTLEVCSPWLGVMENAPTSRDYSGDFMTRLMAKDLGLAQEVARADVSSTPMGSLTLSLYRLLLKQGYVERNLSVVWKLFDPTQGQQTGRWIRVQAGRFDDTRGPP